MSGDGGLTVLGSAVTYEAKDEGEVPTDVKEALARWRVAYDQHQREQRQAQQVHAQQVAEASRRITHALNARTPPSSAPSSLPPSAKLLSDHSARPLLTHAATNLSGGQSREVRVSGARGLSGAQSQLVVVSSSSPGSSDQQLQPLAARVASNNFVLPETVEELPSAMVVGTDMEDRSLC